MAAAKMKEQAPAGPQPVAGGKWPDTGPRVLRARTGRGSPRAVQPTPREEPVLRWEVLRAPLAPAPAAPVLVTPHRLELVPGDALQVTVHAEQQQVAVMAPQGVSRGPPDSCLEQPVHVPRRQAGSPAPPHTREEESPPEQESGNMGDTHSLHRASGPGTTGQRHVPLLQGMEGRGLGLSDGEGLRARLPPVWAPSLPARGGVGLGPELRGV